MHVSPMPFQLSLSKEEAADVDSPVTHRFSAALAASVIFAASLRGQAPQSPPSDVDAELAAMRSENAAIKEQLRRMDENQKRLEEQQKGNAGPAYRNAKAA